MKRLGMLAFSALTFALTLVPMSVDAQSSCSCSWLVTQGDNTGASDCGTGHAMNENNLRSYAYWTCGRAPCTAVYTQLSCTTDAYSTVTASGLLNYKCC
jgi:hypothetical protein